MLIENNQSCSTCAVKDVILYWAPKGHLTSPLGFYYDFSFKLVKFPFAHYGRKLFYLLERRSRTLLLLLIQTGFVLDFNKLFFFHSTAMTTEVMRMFWHFWDVYAQG